MPFNFEQEFYCKLYMLQKSNNKNKKKKKKEKEKEN